MSERRHVLLLILFPAVVQAVIVTAFGEAMIAWDEFHYAHLLRAIGEGRPWLSWILQQHNEHRIVWTKLVMLAHAPFSSWNPMVEMYVSALLVGVIALGIWRLYRSAGHEAPVYFWPVALLLCSTAQYMNMLYGLMTCHYFTVGGMVWALVFLTRGTWPALGAAVGLAVAATLSTLNGIIIWPVGLLVLFIQGRPRARWIVWTVAAAALVVAYFVHFQRPGQIPPTVWSLHTVGVIVLTAITSLGAPLVAASTLWGGVLGILTLALIVVSWAVVRVERNATEHAGLIGLMLVALGSAASVGVGRHSAGLASGLESKYVTYATIGLIGPYLSLVCQRTNRFRKWLLIGWLAVVGTGLLAANMFGFSQIAVWAKTRRLHRYLVQTADRQSDDTMATVYKRKEVRLLVAYLRAAHLGPFREPVDALLPSRERGPTASREILSGSEIRAKVLCPVQTLRDIAVLVRPISPLPGRTLGSVHVGLEADGRPVAQSSAQVKELSEVWVRLELEEPIETCRDRLLGVRVWTEGAAPGGSVVALTFPGYYGGITRQGNVVVANRDLGIAFNGVANGLLP